MVIYTFRHLEDALRKAESALGMVEDLATKKSDPGVAKLVGITIDGVITLLEIVQDWESEAEEPFLP